MSEPIDLAKAAFDFRNYSRPSDERGFVYSPLDVPMRRVARMKRTKALIVGRVMRVFARAASTLMFGQFQTVETDLSGPDLSRMLRYT